MLRLLDVRTPGEFAGGHIDGSYNVPLANLPEHRDELMTTAEPVVLICQSGRRADLAEDQLRAAGLPHIHVLDGGVNAWKSAELPLLRLSGKQPWDLERQVRITAGGIVAAAIAVSTVWSPARYIAGGVGVGLMIAALTNTCAMGMLLMKLPYNRTTTNTCELPGIAQTLTTSSPLPQHEGRP